MAVPEPASGALPRCLETIHCHGQAGCASGSSAQPTRFLRQSAYQGETKSRILPAGRPRPVPPPAPILQPLHAPLPFRGHRRHLGTQPCLSILCHSDP